MKRRELIAALGMVLAVPWLVRAQQPGPVRRVAMLIAQATEEDFEYEGRVSALVEALRGLGWIDGRNLKLSVYRTKPSPDEISKRIAELVAENPEIIIAGGGTEGDIQVTLDLTSAVSATPSPTPTASC